MKPGSGSPHSHATGSGGTRHRPMTGSSNNQQPSTLRGRPRRHIHAAVVTSRSSVSAGGRSVAGRGIDGSTRADATASARVGLAGVCLLVAMPSSTDAINGSAPVAGRLVERTCDTAAGLPPTDCYWLEVSERRDAPDAGTIRLWVTVVHGEGAAAELPPVIDVTGGPGDAASTAWVNGSVVLDGDGRTIVVIDQRGTGRSEPRLDCDFESGPPSTIPWPERVAARRLQVVACRDRLIADGVDLDGYDTVESAADFVDLRHALGVDQFLLRGYSYGGRLAERDLPPGSRRCCRAVARLPAHQFTSGRGESARTWQRRTRPAGCVVPRTAGVRRVGYAEHERRSRRSAPRCRAIRGCQRVGRRRRGALQRRVPRHVSHRPAPRHSVGDRVDRRWRQRHHRRIRRRVASDVRRSTRRPRRWTLRGRHVRRRRTLRERRRSRPPSPIRASGKNSCSTASHATCGMYSQSTRTNSEA